MSITVGQIPGAIATCQTLDSQIQSFEAFLNEVLTLANNNWTYTLNVGGQNIQFTLTAQQQANLITQYTNSKALLVTTFNQFP